MSDFQLSLLLPQVFLLVFGLLALAVGLWSASDGWLWHSLTPGLMAVAGLLLAMYGQIAIVLWLLPRFRPLPVTQLSGALTIDAAGTAFGLLACLGTLVVVVMSMEHLSGDTRNQGEYYFLLLCACGAATIAALAADLLIVYLGIEFLGICSYALAGFSKSEDRAVEAALKYFLFGSACSAAMLFGMSLLFGVTGTLSLEKIGERLAVGGLPEPVLWVALVLMFAGFGFKLAAAPFHFWAPDVYEGAPTPVTAFLSVVSKAAGLAVLLRFLWTALPYGPNWLGLMVAASAISMTLGNLAAIPQRNIKRMLAYSSIAQAGYLLIGYAALGADLANPGGIAVPGILVYLLAYLLANLGLFACVVAVGRAASSDEIWAYEGMMRRSPVIAVSMVVFFLSLAGIPPTLGFAGKFYIFAAAIQSRSLALWCLAALGVANSVVSVYYYFNVTRTMFFNDPPEDEHLQLHPASFWAIATTAVASIVLLLLLNPVGRWAAANAWMSFTPR